MAGLTIKDVRARFPQYGDMSDQQLADALHSKFYSDIPKEDFYGRIGFQTGGFDAAGADPVSQPVRPPGPARTAPALPAMASPAPGGPSMSVPPMQPQPPAADLASMLMGAAPVSPMMPGGIGPMMAPQMPPEGTRGQTPGVIPPQGRGPIPPQIPVNGAPPAVDTYQPDVPFDPRALPQPGQMPAPALAAAVPQVPAAPDPFAGESLVDLLARRGQQFSRGAAEIVAGIPEGAAISGTRADIREAEGAAGLRDQRAETIAGIEQQLARPDLPPTTRAFLERNLADLTQGQETLGGMASQPIVPPEQRPAYAMGDKVRGAVERTVGAPDPRDTSFWSKLAEGSGSMVGFVAASLAGSVAGGPAGGVVAGATAGAGVNAAQIYREAKQAGASQDEALAASRLAAILGSTEVVPIGRALDLLPGGVRSQVANQLVRRLIDAGASGGEEAIQEAVNGIGNNLIAKGFYDPERGAFDDVGEQALIGAILGGGLGAVAPAVRPGPNEAAPPQNPQRAPGPVDPEDRGPSRFQLTDTPDEPAAPAPEQPVAAPREAPPEPQEQPEAADGRFEVLDELETVAGETRPTGRKVRINLETGDVSPVDEAPVAQPVAERQPQSDTPKEVGPGAEAAAGATNIEGVRGEPDAQGRPGPVYARLDNETTKSIKTDPQTFQYKAGGDTEGVTDTLRSVKAFDPKRAGQVILYQRENGELVVADGHQRTGLARRAAQSGQQDVGGMAALIYREADGYTPKEVMTEAALANIGQGSGTAIDAARIFRNMPGATLDDLNLPRQTDSVARRGMDLSRLSDDAFGMVANGVASERDGGIVGRVVQDADAQSDVLDLLTKMKLPNAFQAESVARQAAEATRGETQTDMFGAIEVKKSLYRERAKVLDGAMKMLRQDKKTFQTLIDRGSSITSEGGNVLDQDANAARAEGDAAALQYLTAEANRKGPISDALTQAAEAYAGGQKLSASIEGFVGAVRRADQSGGEASAAPRQDAPREAAGGRATEVDPATRQSTTSWVIRDKATGDVVMETRDRKKVDALNTEKYEAVPIGQHLGELNQEGSPARKAATERTDAGEQAVIAGAEKDAAKSEAARKPDQKRETEVRAQQSKMRTTVPQQDAGGLFDTQGDMLDNIEQRFAEDSGLTYSKDQAVYGTPLDIFYSPVLRAVEGAKQKAAPGKDWMAILSKSPGVKKVELDWLGVEDWLAAQEGQVPREALTDFVRGSQIEVVEERLEGARAGKPWITEGDDGWNIEINGRMHFPEPVSEATALDAFAELNDRYTEDENAGPRHEGYTEDGGENYREILLRMPNLHREGANAPERRGVKTPSDPFEQVPFDADAKRPFVQSSHFDQENIVVHARVKDRRGPNGERVLFVEEIQSDLGTKWRDAAEDPAVTARRRELMAERDTLDEERRVVQQRAIPIMWEYLQENAKPQERSIAPVDAFRELFRDMRAFDGETVSSTPAKYGREALRERDGEVYDDMLALARRTEANRRELLRLGTEKTAPAALPRTPFENENYYALMVKRLLRLAAEDGYDRLSWTPGYMQAERWNAAAQSVVEGVEWDMGASGARKTVRLQMSGANTYWVNVDDAGKIDNSDGSAAARQLEGKPLSALIGPSLAKQIMDEPSGSVDGQKITFPDSGYAIAYDQHIRKAVEKIAKKGGARVYTDKTLPDMGPPEPTLESLRRRVRDMDPDETIDLALKTGAMDEFNANAWRKAAPSMKAQLANKLLAGQLRTMFPAEVGQGNPVWSVDITDQLREVATEPLSILQTPIPGALHVDPEVARKALPRLRAELDRLNLKRVRLSLDQSGRNRQGAFEASRFGAMDILVGQSLNLDKTVYHESIHAMRFLDLFSAEEWSTLTKAAESKWLEQYDIATRYPHLTREEQIEEAIAEAFADAAASRKRPRNDYIARAFNKIYRLLRAIRTAFKGLDADEVFLRAYAGEIGARDAGNTGFWADVAAARNPGDPRIMEQAPPALEPAEPEAAAKHILGAIKDVAAEYEYVGIRITETPLSVGQTVPPSRVWDDGSPTDEMLDGASAIEIELTEKGVTEALLLAGAVAKPKGGYFGRHVSVVASDKASRGVDRGEIVLNDAVVLAAFEREGNMGRIVIDPSGRADGMTDRISKDQAAPAPRPSRGPGPLLGAPHIPNRTVWDELTAANKPIWGRVKGAKDAAYDATDRARILIQDRMLPLLRAQQAIETYAGAKLPDELSAYQTEVTFSGKAGRHLDVIDRDYTKPIIDILRENKGLSVDDVGEWLTALHAEERNKRIAAINKDMPDAGSGMATAEARRILRDMRAGPHRAALEEISRLLGDLRKRTLDLRVDAGLLSKDDADALRAMYKHYVPLKGFAETDNAEASLDVTGVGRRYSIRGPETQRAMGRKTRPFNPLMTAIVQAQEVAIRAEKNRVAQAVYRLAEQYPAPKLWEVKGVKQKRYFNKTTGMVETRAEGPVTPKMEENEMAVKIDGVEKRIIFHDARLTRALGQVGADQVAGLAAVAAAFNRFRSTMLTTLSPAFIIRNAFRDFIGAAININALAGGDAAAIRKGMRKNWIRALAGSWGGLEGKEDTEWQKHFAEFEKSGAKVHFFRLENPEASMKDFEKRLSMARSPRALRALRTVVNPVNLFSADYNPALAAMERANLAVDNAVRLAAFVEARKLGWSQQRAANLAKDLTVNFNRRGELTKHFNAWFLFFNAAVQGLHVVAKAMKTSAGLKAAGAGVVLGALVGFINASLSEEDEDGELAYDKIPSYITKMNMTGMVLDDGGSAVTIPLPYIYAIFPYMGEQISKVSRGVKTPAEALGDVMVATLEQTAPIQLGEVVEGGGVAKFRAVTPTLFQLPYELATNQDWLERQIRPEDPYGDYGPQSEKYYASVSSASRAIARIMNAATGGTVAEAGKISVSPEYIDHAMTFLTGGAGRFVGQMADIAVKLATGEEVEMRGIPLAGQVKYNTGDWLDRDRYYRFREEVRTALAAVKDASESGIAVSTERKRLSTLEQAMKDAEKLLRETRKAKRLVEASDLSAREQADRKNLIYEREAGIFLSFNKRYLNVMGPQGE